MKGKQIEFANVQLSNDNPFVLFGGLNVLENRELSLRVAETFKVVCEDLDIPLVFKASFDKANRSSIESFRGPGLEDGVRWLEDIKEQLSLPIITDVHEVVQVKPVAEVADVIQLPAFLSRQTDLIAAMAATNRPINIKKAQFLAPEEMIYILRKFESLGNSKLIICERGSIYGYKNLIVDMLGLSVMKNFEYPLIFDVTHSLQQPGGLAGAAGGRRMYVAQLAKAGLSQGLAGLFLEAHPNPSEALCDGPSALKIDRLRPFLEQMKELDYLIKSQLPIDTA
ncbi:MAG: 3-deoxy-8-phosphooctulonate synthase [Gammaproteobacteria bacterium]|nr:3-deoxy-8-phosphooctulonate synthase [Gammaproteobacteria bacterium]OUV76486.1 MAG: 3-deoxy-8-phosphooctulonate synthase [Gammaproteobacteria bacterium TMED139]